MFVNLPQLKSITLIKSEQYKTSFPWYIIPLMILLVMSFWNVFFFESHDISHYYFSLSSIFFVVLAVIFYIAPKNNVLFNPLYFLITFLLSERIMAFENSNQPPSAFKSTLILSIDFEIQYNPLTFQYWNKYGLQKTIWSVIIAPQTTQGYTIKISKYFIPLNNLHSIIRIKNSHFL
jgi:hypothetical protein